MLRKVIAGGHTGVDRAGLDAAREAGIPTGGYCPHGVLPEDSILPESYSMTELKSLLSAQGTQKNVVEADGTLILNKGEVTGGTLLTQVFATEHGKPYLVVQLDAVKVIKQERVIDWLAEQEIKVLTIAGPRESKYPDGIYNEARHYLQALFSLARVRTGPANHPPLGA